MAKVIIGFDGSAESEGALRWGIHEASLLGWPAHLVQSWRDPALAVSPVSASWSDSEVVERELDASLRHLVDKLVESHPDVEVTLEITGGRPVTDLLAAADDPDDVLVVGARGRGGFLGLGLGSVSSKLARKATTPVVVVRHVDVDGSAAPVLVGVDGRESGRRALRWAAEQARLRNVPLVALLAWSYLEPESEDGPGGFLPDYDDTKAQAVLAGIVTDELGDDPVVEVRRVTRCELAPEAILGEAGEVQLIVVGAHGSSGPGLFGVGSVSQQVLMHAPCPVAIVRPPATS